MSHAVSRRLRPDQPRSPQLQSRQSSDQDEIDGTDLKSRRDEIQAIPYAPLDGFAAFSERLRDGSRQGFVISACVHMDEWFAYELYLI